MSKKDFSLRDALRISAAAVRAAYGDYTAAAIESINIAARSFKIIITLIIGFLMLFTVLIATLDSLIPGFDELYGIHNYINQTNPIDGDPYTDGQKSSYKGIDIFAKKDIPPNAVEKTKIIENEVNKHPLPAIK